MISKPGRGPSGSLDAALGKNRYTLAGVAGTSSGAVAAAFIAAGAKPDDIIDRKGRVPFCDELGLGRFLDLFGIRGWRRLKLLRGTSSPESAIRRDIERLKARMGGTSLTPEAAAKKANENAIVPPPRVGAATAFVSLIVLVIAGPDLIAKIPYAAQIVASWNVSASWFFLFFWVVLHISFSLTGQKARRVERDAKQAKLRSFSDRIRALLHPFASVGYALGATSVVSVILKLFGATWFGSLVARIVEPIDPIIVAADAFLFAASLLVLVRQFIKGSIEPVEIADDLNTMLCALVTKTCARNEDDTKFVWTPKTGKKSALAEIIAAVPDHRITFKELYDETHIHLAVMTADVIANEGFVFSTTTTPNDPIADAVAASLAIPFAFRALKYKKNRVLVDGAIVSSIPAWLHRRDRNRDPDCKILAVRIESGGPDDWIPYLNKLREKFIKATPRDGRPIVFWFRERKRKLQFLLAHWRLAAVWPVGLISNTLYTGAFGARALELDASDRLESIRLPCKLGLFDFDIGEAALVEELNRLETTARLQIESRLWLCEDSFLKACAQIADTLRSVGKGISEEVGYLRMFWVEQDGNAKSVRIKHTYKFGEKHFDDRLTLPFGTSMSAWAVESEKSQFATQKVLDLMMAGHMNRYRRAAKWKGRAWCWAIPIVNIKPGKASERYVGALAIESDKPLKNFDDALGEEAERRSDMWMRDGALKEEAELRANAEKTSGGLMRDLENDIERMLRIDFVRLKVS
jgi:predicted acylesterase/phospholipase RssA